MIAVCLATLTYYLWPIHGLLFEVYALTGLFIAFRAAPPVKRWLAGLPPLHRGIFYVLLAVVVAGHLRSDKRTYFPFVAWDIFSAVSEQDTVSCRELIGTTVSGKSVRLLVEQLFPSIVQFDLPPQNEPEQMAHLVTALARAYNARHTADPVRQVDLVRMAVQLHSPSRPSHRPPSCQFLQRYDISSAPSS